MPTSRPTTPIATSDCSSDGESLSDLGSSWTDLETNHSGNGRHSPLTISEAGDSEDARSAIDRYDRETWIGLPPERSGQNEHDIVDDTVHVGSPSVAAAAAAASPASSLAPEIPELALESWVADAVESSMISDDDTSTPHMSFHSASSPLRLSFPDPLSNSEEDLLPPQSALRARSRLTEDTPDARSHSPAPTESISSVTAHSESATTPSEVSFSVPDEDEAHHKEPGNELPPLELAASPVEYALAIILLGHSPLPHLKGITLSTIIDMVGTAFGGSPRIVEGSETTRIYEVPIYAGQHKSGIGSEETSKYRVIVQDRTTGMSSSSGFTTLHCPTLALIFIQPPLSSPSLPSLPQNSRYIPLLLPSVSDTFALSLLDLSPSILFEHSVPDIPTPNNVAMKSFAMHQCKEMGIEGNRLDGLKDVLTVEQFSRFSADEMSSAIRDFLFPSKEMPKRELDEMPNNTRVLSGSSTFRKHIVFISALLIALLFGSTVLLRGSSPIAPQVDRQTSSSSSTQGPKLWPLLHPFANSRTSTPQPIPSSSEHPQSTPQSLMPGSLRSFAASVFSSDSDKERAASTPTSSPSKGKGKVRQDTGHQADETHQVRPATIDPAAPHLTIDAPSPKSLSLLPQAAFPNRANGKGKEKATDIVPKSQNPFPSSATSLSTRISTALAPLVDRVHTDIRELLEALEALLQALWSLRRETSQGISELVHVLSEHLQAGQKFADKVHRAARETASKRHARARHNARKVRDMGRKYVGAAGQHFKRSMESVRGNAIALKDEMLSRRSKFKERRTQRKTGGKKKNRGGCDRKGRCSEYVFESVLGLVV